MRTWPGLAAIGAGIVHLGVAAGSPPLLLGLLAVVGAAELTWGVVALARIPPLPRVALVVAAALIALWLVALLVPVAAHHAGGAMPAGATTSVVPVGAGATGALLDLVVAVVLALRLRSGDTGDGTGGAVRFLLLAAIGATATGALVIAGLSGTSVGGTMPMH